MPVAPKPKTRAFPPEQVAATAMAVVGIVGQVVPLEQEAKEGIAQLATTAVVTLSASGAAIKLGRQKWWKNFMIDVDDDPATPPVLARKFLAIVAAAVFVAIGSLTALIVTLIW